jgi:hypothetical protein
VWATELRMEATRLNLSSLAPLNRRPKSLQMLARDLEAETRQGAGKTGSIATKANPGSILALAIVIIGIIGRLRRFYESSCCRSANTEWLPSRIYFAVCRIDCGLRRNGYL